MAENTPIAGVDPGDDESDADVGTSEEERDGESITAELLLRSGASVAGTPTEVLDDLSRLRANGDVAEFTVTRWPNEADLATGEGAAVRERFERFSRWADANGVSVTPPFERRTVSSLVGSSKEVLTVPMLCLVVREGSDLVGVYPCTGDDRTWTIRDALDALADGGAPPVSGTA